MKTYEEACAIVAEVRLSGMVGDYRSAFNFAGGAMLLAEIYEKGQNEVANDCYELYLKRRSVMDQAIKEARKAQSRAENEERRLANLAKVSNV